MALTYSIDQVDENGKELLTYGTEDFPIAFFDDDLTKVAVPNHWHDELEIVVITEGKVIVRIAGQEFMLTAGDGYFANSAVLHAAELKTVTGHQHATVFNPRVISAPGDLAWKTYVEPLLRDPQLPFVRLSASVPWQKEILSCSEKAWDLGAYDKSDYPVEVPYLLGKVIAGLTRHADTVKSELHYTSKYQRDADGVPVDRVQRERDFLADAVALRAVMVFTTDHVSLDGVGFNDRHAALVADGRTAVAVQRPAGFRLIDSAVGIV